MLTMILIELFLYVTKSPNLLTVMQTIGIALVTVYIPVALFLFSQSGEDGHYENVDKIVILDYVINAKTLIFKMGLIFFPLLFWDVDFTITKIVLFTVWFIGVAATTQPIVKAYCWVRNPKFDIRIAYFVKHQKAFDNADLWKEMWEQRNGNISQIKKTCDVFFDTIDALWQDPSTEYFKVVPRLLDDYRIFLAREDFLTISLLSGALQKILSLHEKAWTSDNNFRKKIEKDNDMAHLDTKVCYGRIASVTSDLLILLATRLPKEKDQYEFFRVLSRHLKENEQYKKNGYVESLFQQFFAGYFDGIERSSVWDVDLDYFPGDWKVTKGNMNAEQMFIPDIVLWNYLEWVVGRFYEKNNAYITIVTRAIFPEMDTNAILFFLKCAITPDGIKEKVKLFVTDGLNLGAAPVIISRSHEEARVSRDILIENTFSIISWVPFLRGEFAEKRLIEYIDELSRLKLNESRLIFNQEQILHLFEELQINLYSKGNSDNKSNLAKSPQIL